MFAMSLIWNFCGELPTPNLGVEALQVSKRFSQQVGKPFEMQVRVPTPIPPKFSDTVVEVKSELQFAEFTHGTCCFLICSWAFDKWFSGQTSPTQRFGNAHFWYPRPARYNRPRFCPYMLSRHGRNTLLRVREPELWCKSSLAFRSTWIAGVFVSLSQEGEAHLFERVGRLST